MTIVVPSPVRLTVASTAVTNNVGVKIYDNGVYLESPGNNGVNFAGLYQNGEEVGSVIYDGKRIEYNGKGVLQIFAHNDYTFGLRLRTKDLPNGDYVAVVSYTKDGETKNYEVPIQIELSRESITEYPSITKNQYELNRYELNLT